MSTFRKLTHRYCLLLLAISVLLASATARAEVVYLRCGQHSINVDMGQRAVTLDGVTGNEGPCGESGSICYTTISDEMVTWEFVCQPRPCGFEGTDFLNRRTGIATLGDAHLGTRETVQCEKAGNKLF